MSVAILFRSHSQHLHLRLRDPRDPLLCLVLHRRQSRSILMPRLVQRVHLGHLMAAECGVNQWAGEQLTIMHRWLTMYRCVSSHVVFQVFLTKFIGNDFVYESGLWLLCCIWSDSYWIFATKNAKQVPVSWLIKILYTVTFIFILFLSLQIIAKHIYS